MLEKGASGSKRGAPTAANVLERKLDNMMRGGIGLSFPTNPAAPSALGGRKIERFDDPCTLSAFALGVGFGRGVAGVFGVQSAHVLLVFRPTYRNRRPYGC